MMWLAAKVRVRVLEPVVRKDLGLGPAARRGGGLGAGGLKEEAVALGPAARRKERKLGGRRLGGGEVALGRRFGEGKEENHEPGRFLRLMGDMLPSPKDFTKGDSDIFFPTDFFLLERIDHFTSGWTSEPKNSGSSKPIKLRRSIILDTAAFIEQFGLPSKTRTKDGYNPLLDDFKNTKFYLSVPTHNVI